MRGRRADRSAEEKVGFAGAIAGAAAAAVVSSCAFLGILLADTMLGLRTDSSWKCGRAATNSLENSLGSYRPFSTGAMKRGQRISQARRKEVRERAAERTRASWTAAQKRGQRSFVSWRVAFRTAAVGGVRDRMRMKSGFV